MMGQSQPSHRLAYKLETYEVFSFNHELVAGAGAVQGLPEGRRGLALGELLARVEERQALARLVSDNVAQLRRRA
jgi:hypothetical protein